MIASAQKNSPFPDVFVFTYGCWEQSEQIEWSNGALVFRPNLWAAPDQTSMWSPTVEDWLKFWTSAQAVNLWIWQKSYLNPLILDGLQWSLEISYQGRTLTSEGSNAFPGWENDPEFPDDCEFGRFLHALQKLTSDRFHWEHFG